MLVSTTSCIHLHIVLRSCARSDAVKASLSLPVATQPYLQCSENLSTIIMQTPWARGSAHTATKAGPAFASAGQTCDPRLINTTCTTYKSRILCTKNIEAQAMCTWKSKINAHQRTHHEQPTNACFDPSGVPNMFTCPPFTYSSSNGVCKRRAAVSILHMGYKRN